MEFVYIDPSVLISIVLGTPRGTQALAILDSRDSCTSEFSPVECQSGLSFHYSAAPAGLPTAEQLLSSLLSRMQMIQITPSIISDARTLVRRYRSGLGLRALDALHIASCAQITTHLGARTIEYITADRRQHNAFTAEGFSGTLLV
ncbi:MAG TPA: type II toxin-antitoxin system VapC family toxin [Candidatus Angelobacter sp.]|jgi:predicted nucleic acid-binding protein|nr:type II toxin-antitoxin system VapC family toxin [Candidatus Angelobacter sp.]